MSLLKKTLSLATGNLLFQKALHVNIRASQFLMGIGAGGGVTSSGERSIFDLLRRQQNPPYCIFDVGANIGQFLELILENIGTDEYTIHSFEPGETTFQQLTDAAPSDPRIVLNNLGISSAPGEATLHSNSEGSALASLTKRRLEHFGILFDDAETVSLTTIDDYCKTNSIEQIDLLKIDIEGHELDALSGARNMFEAGAIGMATFEFGGCNVDTRTYFQDFWYFFKDLNMDICRITPSGYFYPIASYNETHEQFKTMNFIAISNVQNTDRSVIRSAG